MQPISSEKPYRGAYEKNRPEPFKLSRSKVEDFVRCSLCFVLDRKGKLARPSSPSFTLNSAVDALLKKEFDEHRARQTVHPVLTELGYSYKPFQHPDIDTWRSNFSGVSILHSPTNFHVFGAVDDIWINDSGELIVVDYKSTAKAQPVEKLSDEVWHQAYRRQLDFYQWLLAQNGFQVSNISYWLYATARNNLDSFDKKLIFDLRLIEHTGDYSWVEPTLLAAKAALDSDELPSASADCEFCAYSQKRNSITKGQAH